MKAKNVLFTGPPRCGKSTLIERLVQQIGTPATGFFTREIREGGRRVGFAIETLDGRQGILAHQSIKSRFRVGKYGVKLEDIDQIAVPAMVPSEPDMLVVIDEIAKMECFSMRFKKTLVSVLNADQRVLGSVALQGDRFIREIRARPDVLLVPVTRQNQDELVEQYVRFFAADRSV